MAFHGAVIVYWTVQKWTPFVKPVFKKKLTPKRKEKTIVQIYNINKNKNYWKLDLIANNIYKSVPDKRHIGMQEKAQLLIFHGILHWLNNYYKIEIYYCDQKVRWNCHKKHKGSRKTGIFFSYIALVELFEEGLEGYTQKLFFDTFKDPKKSVGKSFFYRTLTLKLNIIYNDHLIFWSQ